MGRALRHRGRGFSLIEMMVVVAILAICVAVALPMFYSLQRQNRLRGEARAILANLTKTRGLAASGKEGGPLSGWGPEDRTRSAGLRIESPTSYSVFIDRNQTTDGDELTLFTVDLAALPDAQTEITTPGPGTELRFRGNGTLMAPQNISIRDNALSETRTVVLTGGGKARLE